MTAEPFDTASDIDGIGTTPSVRAVRAFIGRRRRRSWLDWYFLGFAAVIALLYLADLLTGPLDRLSAVADHPATDQTASHAAAVQAVAGTGLVLGVAIGLLLLAQALGPLVLSPADASWLLPSPLSRRSVLCRCAVNVALLSVVAGALLGVLALAMAGPFLRPGSSTLPSSWLVLSALAGAAFCLAATAGEVLTQPGEHGRAVVRTCGAVIGLTAMVAALAGERWTSVSRAITTGFGGLSTSVFGSVAIITLVLAALVGTLAWRRLPRFPASVLRTDSARAGRTLTAVAFLNLPLLTWIAEDNYWRGRVIASKPWPKLPPALALAWADWRRLARRPVLLAVTAASALIPALAGAAITGHGRSYVIAAALLFGGIAAGTQGTATTKRDLNDITFRRLLGIDERQALAARAILPALLSAAWLAIAFALLIAVGILHGGLWIAVGLAAGPGVAAASLRMAKTAPINPAEQGPDLPVMPPPWAITRALSELLGLIAMYPALRAVLMGSAHATTLVVQLVVSAVILGIYVMAARRG